MNRVAAPLLERGYRRACRSDLNVAPPRPTGRSRRIEESRVVGSGRAAFDVAARALLSFRVHREAGLAVHPPGVSADEGAVVLLGIGYRRVAVLAPCRVIDGWSDRRSAGFRYATLEGHPESGWEEFVVTADGAGKTVTFAITAESAPASAAGRLVRPLHELVQDRIIGSYLTAMERIVVRASTDGPGR